MIKKVVFIWCWLSTFGEVMANGYVTVSPVKEFKYTINNTALTNKAGAVMVKSWIIPGTYTGSVSCPMSSIPASTHFFTAKYTNGKSADANGWVQLNDYLDMKVDIFIAGRVNRFVAVPFNNFDNNNVEHSCQRGVNTLVTDYGSGGRGQVSLRVRKPIINGVKLNEYVEVELFGRLGNTVNTIGPNPMARIILDLGLLFVPEKCTVNGGQMIQVEFGELPQQGLDGNRFAKEVPLTVRCSGGVFDNAVPLKINMALSGKSASFSQSDLRTTRDGYQGSKVSSDLAIRFKQLDGLPLLLNSFYPVTLQGDSGRWGFTAAPLQVAGSEVTPGDFYATATIVAAFP